MMMPPDEHAPISPSRLQRIIDCPGSYKLARTIEEGQQSSYAAEGSHLHAAVETHIKKYLDSAFVTPIRANVVDPPLNKEQLYAVQDCVDYLAQVIKPITGPDLLMFVEKRVFLKEFHSVLYDCHGTCDIILKTASETHVIDWKFGKGVPVYAQDNDQLMAYLTGAIRSFEDLFAKSDSSFHIHVVQPRLDIYDHIELTAQEVDQWLSMRLIPGVTRAYEKHAPFCPGTKQCRWCPASSKCRARFNQANQTAADVFGAINKMPDEITLEELAKLLQGAKQYEDYIKSIRLFLQCQLEAGKTVPHWKMVHGRSLRRWLVEESEVERVLADNGVDMDELYTSKFITPAKAEKLRRGWKKEPWLIDLIEKPEGKPTMVPDTDKRKPIEYLSAEQKFKEVTNG